MFSQLKEKVCDVRGESFWAIPVEDGDGGTSVDNRVPEMNFRGSEIKYGGDAKGDEAKGLEVRE